MKISFHGAAKTVTGSKHLIHLDNGKKLLLDCGLFQGMGQETGALNATFGFDAKTIDYAILSHAHIDHSGLLPKLVKEGFKGKIYCTPPTYDLAQAMLLDSAYIQESDVKFVNKRRAKKNLPAIEPLYTVKDAQDVFTYLEVVSYDKKTEIEPGLSFYFTDAGHILGSAAVHVLIKENNRTKQITFSGDVGRYRDVILKSPETFTQADVIIIESTYGNSLHEEHSTTENDLLINIENTCLHKRGVLVIPAFSVGRTQELLLALSNLENQGKLPRLKYFVDSPLSTKITEIVNAHPRYYNDKLRLQMLSDSNPFGFKGLKFITDANESKSLNELKEPHVIISASGMAEAGRIKHHIANRIDDTKNTILLVGYCTPFSLGGMLMAGNKQVKIFGEMHEVRAEVATMRSMSAHGDYEDLLQFLAGQDRELTQKVFVVHGEPKVQEAFKLKLENSGFKDVIIPERHSEHDV